MDYVALFNTLHPDFFADESFRSLPPEHVFDEQLLDLRTFSADQIDLPCPAGITFGFYAGDIDTLRAAVRQVDEDWVQYFSEGDRIYCAFDGNQVVSFCLLDEFGTYEQLRVAGPGCVGTVPSHRQRGIGLKMVQNATQILKEDGYDLSYIHYTHVGHWYARLGYKTILKWNANGIIG